MDARRSLIRAIDAIISSACASSRRSKGVGIKGWPCPRRRLAVCRIARARARACSSLLKAKRPPPPPPPAAPNDMEAAARIITSPFRLMERVGDYVADKIVPTPPGFPAFASAAAPAPAPAPTRAAPTEDEVPALVLRVAEVADATTPAKREAATRKTGGGVAKKGAAQPKKRRSPTLAVKAEPQRERPAPPRQLRRTVAHASR